MPGLSGRDLIRALRVDPAFNTIRIIGLGMMEKEALTGVSDHVLKPVRRSALEAVLLRLLHPTAPRMISAPSGGGHILVVEDNTLNQLIASAFLSRNGYTCDIAQNGKLALDAMESRRYDLVLMDCMMPEMDGYEATRQLRKRGYTLPIIAMTANTVVDARPECQRAGMEDCLPKPLDLSLLSEVLQRWIPQSAPRPPVDLGVNSEKLLRVFHEDLPRYLERAEEASRRDDLEGLARVAHTLKPSAYYLGFSELFKLCTHVEERAASGPPEDALREAKLLPVALASLHQEFLARVQ
jgi:CheY-like chemotaxis protein/HPt (histidine-containing phosphotransfer) domain-containing protein